MRTLAPAWLNLRRRVRSARAETHDVSSLGQLSTAALERGQRLDPFARRESPQHRCRLKIDLRDRSLAMIADERGLPVGRERDAHERRSGRLHRALRRMQVSSIEDIDLSGSDAGQYPSAIGAIEDLVDALLGALHA